MKPVTLPAKSITFKVKENDYTINYPDTGGLMEIEIFKTSLSRGAYETISKTSTISSDYVRFMIDMIALFSVLCPNLKKDLKVETFSQLAVIDSKMLLGVYIKSILPWWSEWEKVLNSPFEEDERETSEETKD